ncbi:MAG TPA: hypothetical protein EYP14_06610 [Planctomycetaceae bacterium]|nr:hypothetical protein [Planctomycetaceae bacterium]
MGTKRLSRRRGAVLVLAAAMMVVVFAFLAFALDVGYIALTRTQLQAATDAAALGAGLKLIDGLGGLPERSASEVDSLARQAAEELAAMHSAGELASVHLNPERDVQLGRYEWNERTGEWTALWGVAPYNLVRVTLRRDQVYPGQEEGPLVGDEELRLFFCPRTRTKDGSPSSSGGRGFAPRRRIPTPTGKRADGPRASDRPR